MIQAAGKLGCREEKKKNKIKSMFLEAALMDVGSETWAAGARAHTGCETKTWNTEMQIQGIIKTGSCTQYSSHSSKFSILKGNLSKRNNRQCHKNNSYSKQNQCAQQHLEKENWKFPAFWTSWIFPQHQLKEKYLKLGIFIVILLKSNFF